jgi:hypothetical protein
MKTKDELLTEINNTVMKPWNWYNTSDEYLRYAKHSWLRDLLLNNFTILYDEIERLKELIK